MAIKEIVVEELVEVPRQWHMERSTSQIKRSLGIMFQNINRKPCFFLQLMLPQIVKLL